MNAQGSDFVRLTGHRALAERLTFSTLTGRPVRISNIRSSSPTQPGLALHEIALLRLLETVTNGTYLEISYSGTTLTYHPGVIMGAPTGVSTDDVIEHNIPTGCTRGAAYFLLPLAMLAPFAQSGLKVRISGPGVITSSTETGDISVDSFRTAVLPLYGLFGIPPASAELRVIQRSSLGGGGSVQVRFAAKFPVPRPLHLNRSPGNIRRVRGVAYSIGVPASSNSRMIYAAREILNQLISDINIAAHYSPAPRNHAQDGKPKHNGGIGFGLSIIAETSKDGVVYSADASSPPSGRVVPEQIGRTCAYQLIQTVCQGGCVGKAAAPMVVTLMAMGPEDIGRVLIARDILGSEEIVSLAKDLKAFGCNAWGIRKGYQPALGDPNYIVSVKGSGGGIAGRKMA